MATVQQQTLSQQQQLLWSISQCNHHPSLSTSQLQATYHLRWLLLSCKESHSSSGSQHAPLSIVPGPLLLQQQAAAYCSRWQT
jgi:hypothetical protein